MLTNQDPYKSCIFPRSKNQKVSSRGLYQRHIIASLALQISSMTKRAIARLVAQKFGLSLRSAYEHVMMELDRCLIPDGIVEQEGTVPAARGPRIYQVNGIPCYRLTDLGMLIASTLDEISIDDRKKLFQHYLMSSGTKLEEDKKEQLLYHMKKYPDFTLELMKHGVSRFLEGRIKHPLDIILQK